MESQKLNNCIKINKFHKNKRKNSNSKKIKKKTIYFSYFLNILLFISSEV